MSSARKFCSALVQVVALWPGSASAEQFLNLPTSTSFPITCRWTCPNPGGGTYYHNATDYGTPTNSEIRAASDGEVILIEDGLAPRQRANKKPYGNHVRIRHPNGYETRYAHLLPNTITVQRGQQVIAGQLLGLSDNTGRSTGPHLHFEVRDPQGRRVNPYGDPPDYAGGCGPNALWLTCPPTPAPPQDVDADGDGFTIGGGDCDDTSRDVHPGAEESCNGTDDNCNGTRDDPWRTGRSTDLDRPCTVGIGARANTGAWVCTPDGRAVVCSADPLPPRSESCDGRDNDCDGESDEDWRTGLSTDLGEPCAVDWSADTCAGATSEGIWACAPDGLAVVCDAPSPEQCNGLDDDCNGTVDDVAPGQLEYDHANCGACGRQCSIFAETCLRGQCADFDCEHDWCLNYCNATNCIACNPTKCDSTARFRCLSDCPYNLPASERLLDCLCHGGCYGFVDCP